MRPLAAMFVVVVAWISIGAVVMPEFAIEPVDVAVTEVSEPVACAAEPKPNVTMAAAIEPTARTLREVSFILKF